jgi:hypothetical protein
MNILVSNAFDQQEAVMIFTEKYTVEDVRAKLTAQNIPFDDIYEVADKDVQYFICEPLWI